MKKLVEKTGFGYCVSISITYNEFLLSYSVWVSKIRNIINHCLLVIGFIFLSCDVQAVGPDPFVISLGEKVYKNPQLLTSDVEPKLKDYNYEEQYYHLIKLDHLMQVDSIEARKYGKKLLENYKNSGDLWFATYVEIVIFREQRFDLDANELEKNITKILETTKSIKDPKLLSFAYIAAAEFYQTEDQLMKAEYYIRALDDLFTTGTLNETPSPFSAEREQVYNLKYMIYSRLGANEIAEEYLQKAKTSLTEKQSLGSLSSIYCIEARSLHRQNKFEEALLNIEKVQNISDQGYAVNCLSRATGLKALIYAAQGKGEALRIAHETINSINSENKRLILNALIYRAQVYSYLGKLREAEQDIDTSLEIIKPLNASALHHEINYAKFYVRYDLGDFKVAITHLHRSMKAREKELTKTNQVVLGYFEELLKAEENKIALATAKRDFIDKEYQLNAEKRINKIYYISLTFSLFVIVVLLGLWHLLNKKNKQLDKLANTDSLTGLYNRHAALRALKAVTTKNKENNGKQEGAIAIIDLDYFKRLNDTYGHDLGDRVLVDFARLAKSMLEPGQILARFGGEEFILACRQSDVIGLKGQIEKVQEAFKSRSADLQVDLPLSFSAGVATLNVGDVSASLKTADIALYEAKQQGRSRVNVG